MAIVLSGASEVSTITNFGELGVILEEITGRDDIPTAAYILTTTDVNNMMRDRGMTSVHTTPAIAEVSLPSDFGEMISAYIDSDPRTALRPQSTFGTNATYQVGGQGCEYNITGGAMFLNPVPDTDADLVMRYTARLPLEFGATASNSILTKYPNVYVYGVLMHHAQLLRDESGVAMWAPNYKQALGDARKDGVSALFSGGPMRPVVPVE